MFQMFYLIEKWTKCFRMSHRKGEPRAFRAGRLGGREDRRLRTNFNFISMLVILKGWMNLIYFFLFLAPPPEPEAGSIIYKTVNIHIFRFFTSLINRQCQNLSNLMIISQILSGSLILFTIFTTWLVHGHDYK